MKSPIFVRALTHAEWSAFEAGRRSRDAFVLRRSQILLASAAGKTAPEIAALVGCATQTVRNVLHTFNALPLGQGNRVLVRGDHRPRQGPSAGPVLGPDQEPQLRALLEQSPRAWGQERSTWTTGSLAQVAFAQGLTPRLLDAETVRLALARLGLKWQRAKKWISSPDAAYARKKTAATA